MIHFLLRIVGYISLGWLCINISRIKTSITIFQITLLSTWHLAAIWLPNCHYFTISICRYFTMSICHYFTMSICQNEKNQGRVKVDSIMELPLIGFSDTTVWRFHLIQSFDVITFFTYMKKRRKKTEN